MIDVKKQRIISDLINRKMALLKLFHDAGTQQEKQRAAAELAEVKSQLAQYGH